MSPDMSKDGGVARSVMSDTSADMSLLIVDDDQPLCIRLGRAMEKRGFSFVGAGSVAEALEAIHNHAPAYAVIDMRLDDGNGLSIVPVLRELRPDCRVVMLTSYGNIVTAVSAVKAGAIDYLPKTGRRRSSRFRAAGT